MTLLAALLLAATPPASPEPAICVTAATMEGETVRRRPDCRENDRAPRRETVRLEAGFFVARDSDGVGREPLVYATNRRIVVVAPDRAPRSAGREAARRGLGRD